MHKAILSIEAQWIAALYQQAPEHDQITVRHVLSRYGLTASLPPTMRAPMLYAYLQEYITRYKGVQIRETTRAMYETAYKNITGQKKQRHLKDTPAQLTDFPCLTDCPMDEITNEELQGFINTLAGSLSRSSIDKVSLLLSQAYKQAIREGKLAINPTKGLKLPQKQPKKVKALAAEQIPSTCLINRPLAEGY